MICALVGEPERGDRLRRFLAPQLAQAIVSTGDDPAQLSPRDRGAALPPDPLPCPDAPECAARLAIEMRDAVARLGETWRKRGHRLGFGIGMAQGYATLGRIGFEDRFDYTAIGAVINLAARLCAEAADGEVLVSGRLAAAAEAVAEVEELGERQFKGMARPLGVACLRTLKTPSN